MCALSLKQMNKSVFNNHLTHAGTPKTLSVAYHSKSICRISEESAIPDFK